MDLLTTIWDTGFGFISYFVPFVFVLTIVVFFHELGHFSVARFFGTRIDAFSIGFGKEIFGWFDKHGTRWKVCWVPLGGYVKFFGDEDAASTPDQKQLEEEKARMTAEEQAECFHFKPLYQRAAIVAAGPFANFLLSIIIFTFFFWIIGQNVLSPRVDTVQEGSAAERAGIQVGDVITEIDGKVIESFDQMVNMISLSSNTEISLIVDRGGQEFTILATPERVEDVDPFGNPVSLGRLGIGRDGNPDNFSKVRYPLNEAIGKGVSQTWFIIDRTVVFLGRLFQGKEDAGQISGPLRIAQISGQVATIGLAALINLAAILSVSIGFINLLPIPMLDGGHLLFYGYEAVAGKPLNERAQDYGFRIGIALVLSMMVFATWNDLVHLFDF